MSYNPPFFFACWVFWNACESMQGGELIPTSLCAHSIYLKSYPFPSFLELTAAGLLSDSSTACPFPCSTNLATNLRRNDPNFSRRRTLPRPHRLPLVCGKAGRQQGVATRPKTKTKTKTTRKRSWDIKGGYGARLRSALRPLLSQPPLFYREGAEVDVLLGRQGARVCFVVICIGILSAWTGMLGRSCCRCRQQFVN